MTTTDLRDLDLDPLILGAAQGLRDIAAGNEIAVSHTADVREYDTVSWTGVSGVTQTRDVSRVDAWDYAIQARDLAKAL